MWLYPNDNKSIARSSERTHTNNRKKGAEDFVVVIANRAPLHVYRPATKLSVEFAGNDDTFLVAPSVHPKCFRHDYNIWDLSVLTKYLKSQ